MAAAQASRAPLHQEEQEPAAADVAHRSLLQSQLLHSQSLAMPRPSLQRTSNRFEAHIWPLQWLKGIELCIQVFCCWLGWLATVVVTPPGMTGCLLLPMQDNERESEYERQNRLSRFQVRRQKNILLQHSFSSRAGWCCCLHGFSKCLRCFLLDHHGMFASTLCTGC